MEMGFTIENSDLGSLIPRSWIFFIFFTRTIVRSTYASQKSLLDPPEDSGLCSSFLHVSSKNSKIIVKKYLKKIVIELFADLETSRNRNLESSLHASCFMLICHPYMMHKSVCCGTACAMLLYHCPSRRLTDLIVPLTIWELAMLSFLSTDAV